MLLISTISWQCIAVTPLLSNYMTSYLPGTIGANTMLCRKTPQAINTPSWGFAKPSTRLFSTLISMLKLLYI